MGGKPTILPEGPEPESAEHRAEGKAAHERAREAEREPEPEGPETEPEAEGPNHTLAGFVVRANAAPAEPGANIFLNMTVLHIHYMGKGVMLF
jgi:hypothetical protein